MDKARVNQLESKQKKPPRLLALFALIFAIALPFILSQSLRHKDVKLIAKQPLNLPKFEKEIVVEKPEVQESEWIILTTKEGDSLASIFSQYKLSAKTLQKVLSGSTEESYLTQLRPNQSIQLLIKEKTLEKLIIPITTNQFLVVYKEGDSYRSKINSRKMNSHNHYLSATVHGSLYSTAKKMGIPYKLIRQMTEIFSWEIDFSKDIRDGDRFTIIYKAYYLEDKPVGTGDIVAVTLHNRGRNFQAIQHKGDDGKRRYFTPEGRSLVKAFDRYPLKFSHISSTFNLNRIHPILKKKRPHKGVDLAAVLGTPIRATGDGKIAILQHHNGYGNVIKIKHNKNYSTIYAHMLRFQKGLRKGSYVKRGQVIGYVGQTGLATGPHCHYEFHINRQPKNPTTIALPRAPSISKTELSVFKAKTSTLLAQLQLFEDAKKIQPDSEIAEVA